MEVAVAVAVDTRDQLGESPWWDASHGCLYWVDIRRPALHRLDQISARVATWPVPSFAGAVVGRDGGGAVVLLADGVYGFDPGSGALSLIVAMRGGDTTRLNDAKCDRVGNLWFGAMRDYGVDDSGGLFRLEPGGAPMCVRGGCRIPNGICFSPDGATVYFTDTPAGGIEQARTTAEPKWSPFAGRDIAPGAPDGATVDADGYVWSARFGGWSVARISPQGRLDRLVRLPVSQPTSCAFGGANLDTLYVTTARQRLTDDELRRQPFAGAVLALDVGVRGIAEPGFAG